jgi:RND family efflux transporter MFP subunit
MTKSKQRILQPIKSDFGTKDADLASLKIEKPQQSERRNSSKFGILLFLMVLMLGIVIVGLLLSDQCKPHLTPGVEVVLTTVTPPFSSQNRIMLSASGYIVAQRMAALGSRGTGRLVSLRVAEGDKVRKGQIVATLQDDDLRALLREAEAELKLKESQIESVTNNLSRQKELMKVGATSSVALDTADARYKEVLASIDLAKARIGSIQTSLEDTVVRAPFAGTVTKKNADVGEVVSPMAAGANARASVVTIADMESLQAAVDVSESNINKVRVGQDCEIILDAYPDQPYAGYVAKIVPTADRTKATILTKIGFKKYDKKALPEMSVKVLFLNKAGNREKEKDYPVIPDTALRSNDNGTFVYRVMDNRAVETRVTVGKRTEGYIELINGIQAGEKIIANLNNKIRDGVKVRAK